MENTGKISAIRTFTREARSPAFAGRRSPERLKGVEGQEYPYFPFSTETREPVYTGSPFSVADRD